MSFVFIISHCRTYTSTKYGFLVKGTYSVRWFGQNKLIPIKTLSIPIKTLSIPTKTLSYERQ